jgi:anti-sigma-K factor RskA
MGVVTEACQDWRGDLAMAAIDRLDPQGRAALATHLEGCTTCRRELGQLQETTQMLALVDPVRLPTWGPQLVAPTSRTLGKLAWTGRWRRALWLSPVAVAVAALAAFVVLSVGPGNSHAITVLLRGSSGIRASAVLHPETGGTEISLTVKGQPPEQTFTVSMQSRYGETWQAGSYRTTRGQVVITLNCAVPTAQITQVSVDNAAGQTVLKAHVP